MSSSAPIGRRWVQGIVGAALVAVGLSGLSALWPGTATAQAGDRADRHDTMHEMMDAMHGEGTAEGTHEVEGAEEMMEQCASMMNMMGDMDMSGGGMMGSR